MRLKVRGERDFPVPPLTLPQPRLGPSLEFPLSSEAVALFADRARAARPDFALSVKNLDNQAVGEIDLPEEIFGYPYKEHLIHLAVVSIRNAGRAGTHKTKGRHEVSGSGKKLWRQKGTGRARVGSRRTPLWTKGGTVHGATDEYVYHVVEGRVEVHDLHATMLHLLGMDHTRLTFRFGGRDMRLTDVHGQVVHDILA